MSDVGTRSTTRRSTMIAAVLVAAVVVSGCANKSATAESGELPATLVEVEGRDIPRVVLTERAVERLGIGFAAVAAGGEGETTVPYPAVVYTSDGKAWVYTSPKPLTFERTAITVTSIRDDVATLSSGPPEGTEVVVLGGAELGGVEEGL